jgi:hypothetical protein
MSRRLRTAGAATVIAGALAAGAPHAQAATDCGSARRPFTDARPLVSITKGDMACSTARGVMRRYWNRSVDAFSQTVRLRYRGVRWVCRPTSGGEVPNRWVCRGGRPARNRLRVLARE